MPGFYVTTIAATVRTYEVDVPTYEEAVAKVQDFINKGTCGHLPTIGEVEPFKERIVH